MAGNIIDLNESIFEAEVKNAAETVLVDFWASWCGPCKMVGPALEEIAEVLAGRLKVCKVNVDDNQKLAADFGVMSIPTLIIFKNGEEKGRITGALGKSELMEKIEKHLG